VHLSSNKKYSTSPPIKKVTISTEEDEITSNYDSDDGWSDDSAELLYVDERYATEKRKITPSVAPIYSTHFYNFKIYNLAMLDSLIPERQYLHYYYPGH
jgi:hypothetical protein